MSVMLTALSNLFEQDLVKGIENRIMGLDRTYKAVVSSRERVVQDELSKDWKAIHTFVTSLGGAMRPGSPNGPDMRSNTGSTQMISAHDTYPGVADVPLPGLGNRFITLAKWRGNTVMNTAMLRAQKIKNTVGNYPAESLMATADLVAHGLATSWYLNDSAKIIALDDAACTLSGGNHVATVTETGGGNVLIEGRFQRIKPGMQFDVWSDGMATCYTQNGWAMLTSNVDMFSPTSITLFFQNTADAVAFNAAATAGTADFDLVPYDAIATKTADGTGLSRLPCGFQSWIRATGTLFGSSFGDLDVTTYGSMFKSYLVTVSAGLTETLLQQYLTTFNEATGIDLDTIVTTQGVLNNMMNTYGPDASTSLVRFERHGEGSKHVLGSSNLGILFNGKMLDLNVSTFIDKGQMSVLKTQDNNLIRYQPPRVDDTIASVEGFDAGIEWLGKMFYDTIWMPSSAPGGGKTDGIEAPFDLPVQHAAREVRGILLSSITETPA